jgi:hypothetical protein
MFVKRLTITSVPDIVCSTSLTTLVATCTFPFGQNLLEARLPLAQGQHIEQSQQAAALSRYCSIFCNSNSGRRWRGRPPPAGCSPSAPGWCPGARVSPPDIILLEQARELEITDTLVPASIRARRGRGENRLERLGLVMAMRAEVKAFSPSKAVGLRRYSRCSGLGNCSRRTWSARLPSTDRTRPPQSK